MRFLFCLGTVLVLSGCGCGGDDDAPRDAAADSPPDAPPTDAPIGGRCPEGLAFDAPPSDPPGGPCALALIPSGFGFRFESLNHRVAKLGAYPVVGPEHAPDECPAATGLRGGDLLGAAEGLWARLPLPDLPDGASRDAGVRPDPAVVRLEYQVVGPSPLVGPEADGGPGSDAGISDAGPAPAPPVRWLRGQVPINLATPRDGGMPPSSVPVRVDLASAGLADAEALVVVIDGIELRTDVAQDPDYPVDWVPAWGYALRGLSASVSTPEREGDAVSFDAAMFFQPGGATPDAMNRAALLARSSAILHWQLLAIDGAVGTGTASVAAMCASGPGTGEVTIPGHAEHDAAAVGFTSFAIRVSPERAGAPPPGDFVRTLSISLRDVVRDPGTGATTVRLHTIVDNGGSPAREALVFEADATIALMEWSGAAVARHHTDLAVSDTVLSEPLEW